MGYGCLGVWASACMGVSGMDVLVHVRGWVYRHTNEDPITHSPSPIYPYTPTNTPMHPPLLMDIVSACSSSYGTLPLAKILVRSPCHHPSFRRDQTP